MEQTCKCGGTIEMDKTLYDGLIVECLKCDKCGNVSFTPGQTQKIIELKDYGVLNCFIDVLKSLMDVVAEKLKIDKNSKEITNVKSQLEETLRANV